MPTKRILGNSIKSTSYFPSISDSVPEVMGRTGSMQPSQKQINSRIITSQFYSNSSGISYTPPNFYSPQHTPSSWQIPTTRTEVYKWNKFWLMNEPRIAMGIDFYSDFPMNGFELECPDASIREYFEKLVQKLNLKFYLPKILREYFGMGDAFVQMQIDCDKCHGQGIDEDGDECDHAGATWAGISILDPITVEVVPIPLSHEESRIYMTPNNELKRLVNEARPKEAYDRVPEALKKLVKTNQKIPLDPLTITHFKHGESSYATYGTSLIRRLFPTLAYKDKLRQAQWIIAERHILPIRIAKVGSDTRPANQNDLDDVQGRMAEIANDPLSTLVTYHDFELDFVGACYSEDTEALTMSGFKKYSEITKDDLVACYNQENNQIEYHKYNKKHVYNYNSEEYGPMIRFHGEYYDSLVTANHMMWIKNKNKWSKVRADKIKENYEILGSVNWAGNIHEETQEKIIENINNDKIESWMLDLPKEFLNLILNKITDSKLTIIEDNDKIKTYKTEEKIIADNIQEILIKLGYNSKVEYLNNIYKISIPKNISETFKIQNITKHSYDGKVWCLEVPTGLFVTRRNGKIGIHGNSGKVLQLTNEIEQIENELIDGLGLTKAALSAEGPTYSNAQVAIEILIKRLDSVRNLISHWIEEKIFKPIAEFNGFTHKNRRGETEYLYPTVRWEDLKLRDNTQKLQYMFSARQSGDLSARTLVEEGLGFSLDNEIENMRLESMSETFANPELGLGSNGVNGGGYAGGGPTMPPEMGGAPPMMMGGGGGEGLEGMPPEAGGMPPAGAAPTGGGPMPSMAPSANVIYENYMKVVADSNDIVKSNIRLAASNVEFYDNNVSGFGIHGTLPEVPDFDALSDITPKWGYPGCSASLLYKMEKNAGFGKKPMENKNPFANATKLEASLHQTILQSQIPAAYFIQYAINGDGHFVVDGAFPDLKIAVEADGATWHLDQEKIQKDKHRDTQLASQGWIVLRFTEDELQDKIQDVRNVIMQAVNLRTQNKNTTPTIANKYNEMKKV